MIDKLNQAEVEAKRSEYLTDLYNRVVGGDIDAGDELSKIALGGFQQARDLVELMDAKPITELKRVSVSLRKNNMNLKETLFCINHPLTAVQAKLRQIEVAIELAGSPAGSTIEEFPGLPVSEAAALIGAARRK